MPKRVGIVRASSSGPAGRDEREERCCYDGKPHMDLLPDPSHGGVCRTHTKRISRKAGRVAEEQVSLPPPPSSNRTDGFPVSGFTVLSRYKAIHRGVNKGSHKGRRPRRCSLA